MSKEPFFDMMTEYHEVEDEEAEDRELLSIWMGVLPHRHRLKTLEEVAEYMGRDVSQLRVWSARDDVLESARRHRRAELLEYASEFVEAITADALTGRAESIKALHALTGDFPMTTELLRNAFQEAAGRVRDSGEGSTPESFLRTLKEVLEGDTGCPHPMSANLVQTNP